MNNQNDGYFNEGTNIENSNENNQNNQNNTVILESTILCG